MGIGRVISRWVVGRGDSIQMAHCAEAALDLKKYKNNKFSQCNSIVFSLCGAAAAPKTKSLTLAN